MFECLSSIKVPSRFSSNIKGIINVSENKFLNLKSHDCHVLMMQLLSVVLRGILPPHVRLATIKLCAFLNAIFQKAINLEQLATLQNNAVQCLVSFDLVFPPSIFDIMTHLLVHLIKEICILSPVFLHNMFSFERFMGVLKKYIHSHSQPKGSIAKGYRTEEVIEFCTLFQTLTQLAFLNLDTRADSAEREHLGRKHILVRETITSIKHTTQFSSLVEPYLEVHKDFLQSQWPGKNEAWIMCQHMQTFGDWLHKKC